MRIMWLIPVNIGALANIAGLLMFLAGFMILALLIMIQDFIGPALCLMASYGFYRFLLALHRHGRAN